MGYSNRTLSAGGSLFDGSISARLASVMAFFAESAGHFPSSCTVPQSAQVSSSSSDSESSSPRGRFELVPGDMLVIVGLDGRTGEGDRGDEIGPDGEEVRGNGKVLTAWGSTRKVGLELEARDSSLGASLGFGIDG
jgi:hypothetical protein